MNKVLPSPARRSLNRFNSASNRSLRLLRTSFAVSVASLLLSGGTSVRAASTNYVWTNPAGGSWATTTNWGPNGTPTLANADIVNFNGTLVGTTVTAGVNNSTGVETISLDGNQGAGTFNFFNTGGTTIVGNSDPANTTAEVLSVGGGSITIASGAGAVTLGGNALSQVSFNPSGSITNITNNSSNLFTIGTNFNVVYAGTNEGFTFTGSGNTLITGAISNSGGGGASLTKAGIGTLTLDGANTYNQKTIVGGGTLIVDASVSGALPTATTSDIQFNGGTFELKGKTTGTTSQTAGNFFLSSGGSGLIVDGNGGTSTTLVFSGYLSNGTPQGSSINVSLLNGGTVNSTSSSLANTNGIISGHIVLNGSDFAAKSTTAGATLGNLVPATTTAFVTATGSSTANYLATDGYTQTATVAANSLKITTTQSGQSLAQGNNTLSLTSGGLLFTGSNDYTISGGTVQTVATTTPDLVISQYAANNNLTITSAIPNTSGGTTATSLTKAGPGMLTLTPTTSNTYTAGTFVNGGTLVTNANGINSGAGGVTVNNVGSVFAPQAGTLLTPGLTTAGATTTGTANIVSVQNGATIAPGGTSAIGMLTLSGANTTGHVLTMGQNSVFSFNLGANNTSDNISFYTFVANDLVVTTAKNSANATVGTNTFAFTGAQAGTYTLFSFYSDNGTTANTVATGLTPTSFDLADSTGLNGFNATLGVGTGSITLTLTAVPEPSTWVMGTLLGGALLVRGCLTRRSKTSRV